MLSVDQRAPIAEEYVTEVLQELSSIGYTYFYDECASILSAMGYDDVKVARRHNIPGMHLSAIKDGVRYAILCTRPTGYVDKSIVQKAMGACAIYSDIHPMLMTTSLIHRNALDFARFSNPPVALFTRDNFFDYKVYMRLREIEERVRRCNPYRASTASYIRYITQEGERVYLFKCLGAATQSAVLATLEECFQPKYQCYVQDLFDTGRVIPLTGMDRNNMRNFVSSLYSHHGRLGFSYVRTSRKNNCLVIGMPQIASQVPVGGYHAW